VPKRPVNYVLEFSRPWKAVDKVLPPGAEKERQPAYVAEFGPEELLVKVSVSLTSTDAAAGNVKAECPGWDFDSVRASARAEWNALLSRTTAEGDETQLRNWYTSLYHLYFQPNDVSDVGDEPHLTALSLWDTFRAAQPWYTLAAPEIIEPEVRTLLTLAKRQGNLPRMSWGGAYMDCMIGEHALSVIADAYLKGFRGFDVQEALTIMTNSVTVAHPGRDKENWPAYERYGYFPFDIEKYDGCSRTLETCFDDWCLSSFAAVLGNRTVAERFRRRSDNWKNLFDPSVGLVRGRDSKGRWREPFDPFRRTDPRGVRPVLCAGSGGTFGQ